MINIQELLQRRALYPISKHEDAWVKAILSSDCPDEWLIVPSGFIHSLMMKSEVNALTESYMLAGIYNLGSPFLDTGVRFELLHLTTEKVNSVDIGIFKARMFDREPRKPDMGMFCLAEEYSAKYGTYISELEKWINEDYTPDHDREGEYEYNTIPLSEFSYYHVAPEYYSRVAMDIRRLLNKEKTVPLSSVAEVFQPVRVPGLAGKVISPQNLNYPFDFGNISVKQATNILIQKNDILFPLVGKGKPFLITEDINEPICASSFMAVIRCIGIQAEYLYLYLNSEVCQVIVQSRSSGTAFARINLATVKAIPIIVPSEPADIYKAQVYQLTHTEKAYSESLARQKQRLVHYQNAFANDEYQPKEKIEDILNLETAQKIRVFDEANMRSFLTADLKELNDCFRVKAYKATLILAGSILEAVLIDWLSDIDGVNYFVEDHYVTDYRTGKQKRAELIDYINEIKYIERPHWMEEASKAHEIRKKRNLVHAKLCMKSDEVNEAVCRQVIDYLKDVLRTRGI